jgi:hypothetical protein
MSETAPLPLIGGGKRGKLDESETVLYSERHHVHFLVSDLMTPLMLIVFPIALVVVWNALDSVDSAPNTEEGVLVQVIEKVSQALIAAFSKIFEALAGIFLPILIPAWIVVIIYLVTRAVFRWWNTWLIVTTKRAIYQPADFLLLWLKGSDEEVPVRILAGIDINPRWVDRIIFWNCSDVEILLRDIEGSRSKDDPRFKLPAIRNPQALRTAVMAAIDADRA